ncbi:MAG: hypothetical protein AAF696_14445, partial [Bacteroidota bacterium]
YIPLAVYIGIISGFACLLAFFSSLNISADDFAMLSLFFTTISIALGLPILHSKQKTTPNS